MFRRLVALAIALMGTPALAAETVGGERAFSFVALGDMPYKLPDDIAKFDRLIAAVNRLKPAFTIHVGDTKGGSTPCSDTEFQRILDQLQTFDGALVYTPGDNEWTDCHRRDAGGFDPRERLAKLRTMFFAQPAKSLGKAPLDIESQAQAMPAYAAYVENARFAKNDVQFISVHVTGSNNGFEAQDPAAAAEFFARDKANVAWIDDGFKRAQQANAKAVVIFMQAEFDQARFPERLDAAPVRLYGCARRDRAGRTRIRQAGAGRQRRRALHRAEADAEQPRQADPECAEADGLWRERCPRRSRDRRSGFARRVRLRAADRAGECEQVGP